jgi:NAD(P)-dependent dehydrogenase (short-subunit alcohol dehydrogenase family)
VGKGAGLMSGELQGRTAVVTGASRGIGLAIAQALLDEGANVVLTSRSDEAAQTAAASLADDRAIGIGAHAADEDAAVACIDTAIEAFGSVDILVNNAGTNPAFGPLVSQDRARFMKTVEVNVWAPLLWTQIAWNAWMGEHGGTVVNTASVGGLSVSPDLGVYNVSKAGLIHLTKQLALELGPKVRVNAVAPGVVRTQLAEALWKEQEELVAGTTLLGRIGEPADVGSAVSFLASDRASWITGATLVIDGGQVLAPAITHSEAERVA